MLGVSGPFLCLWPAGRGREGEGELLRWGRVDLTSSRVQDLGYLSTSNEMWLAVTYSEV